MSQGSSLPSVEAAASSQPAPNILLFGPSGCGKSSIINLLSGKEVAPVSHDAIKGTFESKAYDVPIQGQTYRIYDTAGLGDGIGGLNSDAGSANLRNLIEELSRSEGSGISLLVFCLRAPRITKMSHKSYELFHDGICQKKVPIVGIITGLENEEPDMESYWENNKHLFERYKLKFSGHACITASRGKKMANGKHKNDAEYKESRALVENLIRERADGKRYKVDTDSKSWMEFILKYLNPFGFIPHVVNNLTMNMGRAKSNPTQEEKKEIANDRGEMRPTPQAPSQVPGSGPGGVGERGAETSPQETKKIGSNHAGEAGPAPQAPSQVLGSGPGGADERGAETLPQETREIVSNHAGEAGPTPQAPSQVPGSGSGGADEREDEKKEGDETSPRERKEITNDRGTGSITQAPSQVPGSVPGGAGEQGTENKEGDGTSAQEKKEIAKDHGETESVPSENQGSGLGVVGVDTALGNVKEEGNEGDKTSPGGKKVEETEPTSEVSSQAPNNPDEAGEHSARLEENEGNMTSVENGKGPGSTELATQMSCQTRGDDPGGAGTEATPGVGKQHGNEGEKTLPRDPEKNAQGCIKFPSQEENVEEQKGNDDLAQPAQQNVTEAGAGEEGTVKPEA